MNFETFKWIVEKNILRYLPADYQDAEVKAERIDKLDLSYTGLQVKKSGQAIVPAVNLDACYKKFMQKEGSDAGKIDRMLREVAGIVQNQPYLDRDMEWMRSYSMVKERLCIRVCDEKRNASVLKDIPYRSYDGLAVTYHIAIKDAADADGKGISALAAVSNEMLEGYGITPEQLDEDAMSNAPRIKPPMLKDLKTVLSEMTENPVFEQDYSGLILLTTEDMCYGAGALFYPGQMEKIAWWLGGKSYYVLPSSVHECLILPEDDETGGLELGKMVRDVNRAVVDPEEWLADEAYHYDLKTGVFEKLENHQKRRLEGCSS